MRALLWLLLGGCAVDLGTSSAELTTTDAWPQLGFSAAHTGATPNETLLDAASVPGLRLAWAATTGLPPGGATVASGRAYVGSENNTLYAFAAITGRRAWRAFAGNDVASTPAAAYGRVYFVANDAKLYAVTSRTGVVEWTANVRPYLGASVDSSDSSPVVHAGVVYVATSTRLFAFAAAGCGAATCGPLWYADVPLIQGSAQAAPAIGKGNVYVVGGTPGTIAALDLYAFSLAGCAAPPCAPVWVRTLPQDTGGYAIPHTLVYNGGRVYLATNEAIFSTYADTGVRRWHRNLPCTGAPAIAGGVVYQPTATGLVALEEANVGATIWRSPPEAGPAWPPAVANGVVYTGLGDAGRLAAFAAGCASGGATCSPLWSDDTDGTRQQPAVAGGMIFVGNERTNELRALSL